MVRVNSGGSSSTVKAPTGAVDLGEALGAVGLAWVLANRCSGDGLELCSCDGEILPRGDPLVPL
jgi:hypothetical protein